MNWKISHRNYFGRRLRMIRKLIDFLEIMNSFEIELIQWKLKNKKSLKILMKA